MYYNKIKQILQNPILIILSMVSGVLFGFYYPKAAQSAEPYGKIFISLLQMSLAPIIVTALGLSVSKLLNFQQRAQYLTRTILIMLGLMFAASAIAAVLAKLFQPGADIVSTTNPMLREISISASIVAKSTIQPIEETFKQSFADVLLASMPENVFNSLAQNQTFQILIFSVILGVAVAYLNDQQRQSTESFFSTTLNIFQRIILSITLFLPIAVFCLMAGGTSVVGVETLTQMGTFVLKAYLCFFILFILATVIISLRTKTSMFMTIAHLRTPIFIAFGTRSAVAAIPSIIDAFENKFGIDESLTKLLVPLGSVIGRFGNVIYFAFTAIFVAEIYRADLSISYFIIIITLSVVGAFATTGATGILTLTMLAIVLDPLNLPIGALMPLLIAVDAIIDPMRTLMMVYINCAAVILIAPKPNTKLSMRSTPLKKTRLKQG
jgi:proton glutamate symport protein